MGDTQTQTLSKVVFFGPEAVTGPWTDWELQTGANPSTARQRAQALKANGDQLAAVQYGAQASYTENYVAKKVSGDAALVLPNVGAVSGGAHIDSVTVAYTQKDFPTLAVAAHRHADAAGALQAHDACRVYTPSVKLPPRAVGVPSTLKDTEGNAIFTCPAGVGMRSLTYALTVTHVDEPDGEGGHLAGQNRDGVETLTIELTGKVVTSELAIHSSWMLPDSDADSQGNTAATTKSITLTKHLAYDEAVTPEGADK